ncbi:MAG: RNase H family protein [Mycobacterium sp.]
MKPARPQPLATVALAMVWAQGEFHFHAVDGTQSWAGTIDTPNPDAAVVEALSRIIPGDSQRARTRVLVRLPPSCETLRETATLAALVPGVSIDATADADHPLMRAAAVGLADDLLPTPPIDPTPLVVATDGSVRGTVTGLGWLASSGVYGLRRFRHSRAQVGRSVALIAELRAIDEAVRKLPSRHLTILTDSLGALDMVRRWTVGDDVLPAGYTTERRSGVAGLVKAQRRIRAHQHRIDVQWVKGHQGHPLNEGANALARLASGNARRGGGLTRAGYRQRAAGMAEAFSSAYRESQ